MIALRCNTTWLDLPSDMRLSISTLNPAFDLDSIERIFSFPFTLQLTETNAAAFRHAQRLDTRDARRTYPAELYIGGMLFERGVLRVTGRKADAIEVAFQNDQIDWTEKLKAIRLRSLLMPVQVAGAEYAPILRFFYHEPLSEEPSVRYVISINTILFDQDSTPDFLEASINDEYPGMASFESVPASDAFYLLIDPSASDVPLQIDLAPSVVQDPATEYIFPAYDPDTDFEAEYDVRDAWLAHMQAILATPDDHVFPTVRADAFYDGRNAAWGNYLNYVAPDGNYQGNDIGVELLPNEGPTDRGWQHTIVPMPFLMPVLETIFSAVNAGVLSGDFPADADLQQLIIFNNRSLDTLLHPRYLFAAGNTQAFGFVYPPLNVAPAEYNLADHLPDLTAYEYLIYLSSMFGLIYSVRGGRAFINTIESQLIQPPEDWTARMEPDYSAETQQYEGFTLDYERQGQDDVVPGQLEALVQEGPEPWDHKSRIFSLYHREYVDEERTWLVPDFPGKGSSPALQISEQCPVMLLLYHGARPDSDANEYPLATHHDRTFSGTSVNAYTLNWQGEKGLYEKFWKSYVQVIEKGVPCTRTARLTIADLMRWRENPCRPITVYSPLGQSTGIIRSINIKISNRYAASYLAEIEMLLI